MTTPEPEISFLQWTRSRWFLLAARIAMFVACAISGYIGVSIANLQARMAVIETSVTAQATLDNQRENASEVFRDGVTEDIAEIKSTQNRIANTQVTMQTDIATMKGVLLRSELATTEQNSWYRQAPLPAGINVKE